MSPRSMREDDDALFSWVDESDGIVAEVLIGDSAELDSTNVGEKNNNNAPIDVFQLERKQVKNFTRVSSLFFELKYIDFLFLDVKWPIYSRNFSFARCSAADVVKLET